MSLALLLIALQAAPVTEASQQPRPGDVVVTGRRQRDALAACIARGCPPAEEVETAMNASTESFYQGKYEESKSTLRRTVERNKRYAAQMPGKMSDLYATYADVAEHEGDTAAFRQSLVASVDVLREHAGPDSPATLAAAVRIGDMYVGSGMMSAADDAYRAARDDAARRGQVRTAGMINLKRAWLAASGTSRTRARALVEETERDYGQDQEVARQLRTLRIRLAMRDGDDKATDALLAELRKTPTAAPVVIYDPPYPRIAPEAANGFDPSGAIALKGRSSSGLMDPGDYRWADIGFWVRPDGSTEDAQVLRHSQSGNWAKPLLAQVVKRRYAPLAADPGSPGRYRIERYTLRPIWQQPTGSRVRKRMGQETLHVLDLTGTTAAQSAEAAAATPLGT